MWGIKIYTKHNQNNEKVMLQYVKLTNMLSFQTIFPRSGPTYKRKVVNPRHQTLHGHLVAIANEPNIFQLTFNRFSTYWSICASMETIFLDSLFTICRQTKSEGISYSYQIVSRSFLQKIWTYMKQWWWKIFSMWSAICCEWWPPSGRWSALT